MHEPKTIPGAVLLEEGNQVWFGLEQQGYPFMSIKTPREMLMTAYDALEISRILHHEHNVPKSDQQQFNIPRTLTGSPPARLLGELASPESAPGGPQPHGSVTALQEQAAPEVGQDKEQVYAFIRYLLNECDDPRATQTLLIDFNGSIHLGDGKESPKKVERTGTSMFMARAIQNGSPVPLTPNKPWVVQGMPTPHDTYKRIFPERCDRFRSCSHLLFGTDAEGNPQHHISGKWGHRLHNAESVFWMIFHWILLSILANADSTLEKGYPTYIWDSLARVQGRDGLIFTPHSGAFHPGYAGLFPLVQALSNHLEHDPYWLPSGDPREDPEYIHECLQRTIFNFLKSNWDEPFMVLEKSHRAR